MRALPLVAAIIAMLAVSTTRAQIDITGSAAISGGIAVVGAVVNGTLYFFHEMAWNAVKGAAESGLPVLETAYIGVAS